MRVTIRHLNNYELILTQQFKQRNIVVHSDPAPGPKDLNELMLWGAFRTFSLNLAI